MIKDKQKAVGNVNILIENKDGSHKKLRYKNTLLRSGKIALANTLANEVNDPFDFYVNRMLFGTNGTSSGTPKFVDETRTGLFGTTLLSKHVINSIDEAAPTTLIATSIVTYDEGVGNNINEMALELANGDLYSMLTFPDLGKTSEMQLTFEWEIAFL